MGEVAPVAAGLAVGVALVVLLATIFNNFDHDFADNRDRINIAVEGLKDAYASGERIALTVHISGYTTVCDPAPTFRIENSESGEVTHGLHFIVLHFCNEGLHSVDETLTTEGPENQLGDIVINKDGNYKVIVEQYGKMVEKEFSVTGSPSTQDAQDFAVRITKNLDETKEFFDTYPNANTTVYFITTCPDESCSTLWRIPSVVEYWYKDDAGKYADLRITIDYGEGKVLSSHTRCMTYDTEEEGVGMAGTSLEGISEFLQDTHCPNI